MSFSFDAVDVKTLGCYLLDTSRHQVLSDVRLDMVEVVGRDGLYDFDAYFGVRNFNLDGMVIGTSFADLLTKLDSLAKLLEPSKGLKRLIFDIRSERFYEAKVASPMIKTFADGLAAKMGIDFIAPIPFAKHITETVSTFSITTNPQTVSEVVGGNWFALPVWRLTANFTATRTLKIKRGTIGGRLEEEVQWTGSIVSGDIFDFDTEKMHVTKNGVASMATVTGIFPRLVGGETNAVTITGFTGTLRITYRRRFL